MAGSTTTASSPAAAWPAPAAPPARRDRKACNDATVPGMSLPMTMDVHGKDPPATQSIPGAAGRRDSMTAGFPWAALWATLSQDIGAAVAALATRQGGALQRLLDQPLDPRLLLPVRLAVALDGLLDHLLDPCFFLRMAPALALGPGQGWQCRDGKREGRERDRMG